MIFSPGVAPEATSTPKIESAEGNTSTGNITENSNEIPAVANVITMKPEPDLDKLGEGITVNEVPDAGESEKYLSELHELQIRNAERDHLQLLDTIIELSERGEIGNNELKKSIPDTIVVIHREGKDAWEFINSQLTKKWIQYKFQTVRNELEVSIKTPHLVQISDKQKGIFDVLGLQVLHTSNFMRNRIIPQYIAKNERIFPKQPPVVVVADYSTFRGNYSVKCHAAPAHLLLMTLLLRYV